MRANTILVIDDEPRSRELLRDVLQDAGFSVIEVGDAADAFAQFTHGIDLVLLDLVMPAAVMDGFTFLAKARERPELMDTPVIVLSGLGESVIEAMNPATASALRIASVVPKPVDLSTLLSAVHAALDSAAVPDQAWRVRSPSTPSHSGFNVLGGRGAAHESGAAPAERGEMREDPARTLD